MANPNKLKTVLLLILLISPAFTQREYYKTLGVKQTTSQADIKKAYRKLSTKFHPDRNKDDKNANDKFAKINVGSY